jgi:hypothetical protein
MEKVWLGLIRYLVTFQVGRKTAVLVFECTS